MLCPKRKLRVGSPAEPKETEINSIVNDAVKLKQIRSRLSRLSSGAQSSPLGIPLFAPRFYPAPRLALPIPSTNALCPRYSSLLSLCLRYSPRHLETQTAWIQTYDET
ncbi:MAG: hypothetical protein R3C56_15220 [Pirellulaceae bacterium]